MLNRSKRNKSQRRQRGGNALMPSEFASPVGGSGAADYSASVYGSADLQHAVAGSNVIDAQNPDAPQSVIEGGNKKRGGQGLVDVAVPALLLYANNRFGRRTKSNKKARKPKRSRRYTRGKR